MRMIYRAARVFADEGFGGLIRRAGYRMFGGKPLNPEALARDALAAQIAAERVDFQKQTDTFHARCAELGLSGVENFYWYHAVDLGAGLLTPGDYDYREQIDAFGFPADLTGKRVLDVGSATGYFAFEFERRGAEVVSVELPSLEKWDVLSAERDQIVREIAEAHSASSPQEAYDRHLDGPFLFCHSRLRSKVKRCYSSVYDLTLAKVGGERFDLVYAGDILMHLFSPLRALDVLSGLCRGSLVLTIEVPFPGPADMPLISFRGLLNGAEGRTWWMPSRTCAEHMLKRLGFGSVGVSGRYSGIARQAWFPYSREVIRGVRV
jgi:SAM-dependent methyltransferase